MVPGDIAAFGKAQLLAALGKLEGLASASGGKLIDEALDGHGRSLLLIAAVEGHAGVVEKLIAAGADLDVKSLNDDETTFGTPLIAAISKRVRNPPTLAPLHPCTPTPINPSRSHTVHAASDAPRLCAAVVLKSSSTRHDSEHPQVTGGRSVWVCVGGVGVAARPSRAAADRGRGGREPEGLRRGRADPAGRGR